MTEGDPAKRSRKILLADGNQSVQRVVRQVAEQRGHVLIQATSAAATLILASEAQPELIVLDLAFADADGRDVLRQLKTRADTQHIPVVVWSGRDGHEFESDSRISLDLGAEDYVEKDDSSSQVDVAKDDAHLLLLKLERVLLRLDG
jgi:two-component system, OmpR family, phosphate regulon response regulator PhoB